MPYFKEHSARLRDPAQFSTCRRTLRKHGGKDYSVILCRKESGKWVDQAFRYPIETWTVSQARMHAKAHKASLFEPAQKKEFALSRAILLYAPPTSTQVRGEEEERDGFPVQRFNKDLIFAGETYRDPKGLWVLPVTEERLDRWIDTFRKMQAEGIPVPVVKDHKVNTDSTLGYLEDLQREGTTLRGTIAARGKESIETVQRVDRVSLGIHPNFEDGKKKTWGEAIWHIGTTPIPIVSGQGGMVRIAASLKTVTEEIPILELVSKGDCKMDLTKIGEILGTDQEVSEENLEDLLNSAFEGWKKKAADAEAQILTLQKEVEGLKESSSKKEEDNPPDPDALEDAVETVGDRVQELSRALGLKPAVAKELELALIGEPEKRNVFLLSRQDSPNSEGRRPLRAMQILSVLEKITPENLVARGSKTKAQTVELSRENADAKEASSEDIESRAASAFGT